MGLKSSAAKPKAGSLLASDKARSPKARLGKMRGVLTRWKHKLDRSDSNRLKMPLRRSSRASLRSLESTRNSSQTLLGRLPGARSSSFSFSSRSTTLPVRALRPIEEEYTIPEFDQETDLKVIVDDLPLQADLDLALERLIPSLEYKDPGKACPSKDRDCPYGYCPCEPYPTQKIDLSSPMFPWFKLPLKIKQRIYELCFPHEDRRISLMRPSLTEAAFPADYFASPWDVLDPVWGLLECCYAWRTEVLAYFWSQFHFHVTLNEFTGPLTCQLSHVWLVENLSMVQRLTIERDYTRLAGSAKKNADQLSFKVAAKVRATVQTYVKELLKRADGMHMAELHVMARGYVGCRPGTESRYVPEAIEDNVAPILELSKILKRCRMSGFSRTFSNSVLQSLFEDRIGRVVPSVPFDNAWPSLMACTLEGLYTPSIMSTSELEQGVKWSIKTKEILKKKFIKKSSKAEKNGAKGSDKNAETRLFTPPAPTSIPQLGSTFAHIEVLPQNSITKNGRSPTVAHDPGAAINFRYEACPTKHWHSLCTTDTSHECY
ncbi:uncharacterized protein LY89DRAFT_506174 [Mollisia scopiformis]|uniref:Uncharacterized protein n=1 Tax=Mollisia scopiformis TaxID=149040 RepID=A0A194XFD8_MOLSC|nr:uncharacterized protein LY89DRAFT_506174 [Mollisia scopiformis]KUJ18849.1 hypothetical protein LY89DRAFT_506174 [Mollisia scopiformis]